MFKCFGNCGREVDDDTFYCPECWKKENPELYLTGETRFTYIDSKNWRLLPALKSWLDRNIWLVVVAELILFLIIGYIVWRQIVI